MEFITAETGGSSVKNSPAPSTKNQPFTPSFTPRPRRNHCRGGSLPARPPLHKPLDRFVLRQPQRVVRLGGISVPILRALPELAGIRAGEDGFVLLALVFEDRHPLLEKLVGRKWHGHLDFV